jgi:predicted DNA-binding transcriptional regulator AlpA
MPEDDDIDIDAAETRRLLGGVSVMWIDRRLNPRSPQYDPEFPQPVQYVEHGRRYWSRREILAYKRRRQRVATERRLARRMAAPGEYVGRGE